MPYGVFRPQSVEVHKMAPTSQQLSPKWFCYELHNHIPFLVTIDNICSVVRLYSSIMLDISICLSMKSANDPDCFVISLVAIRVHWRQTNQCHSQHEDTPYGVFITIQKTGWTSEWADDGYYISVPLLSWLLWKCSVLSFPVQNFFAEYLICNCGCH